MKRRQALASAQREAFDLLDRMSRTLTPSSDQIIVQWIKRAEKIQADLEKALGDPYE